MGEGFPFAIVLAVVFIGVILGVHQAKKERKETQASNKNQA